MNNYFNATGLQVVKWANEGLHGGMDVGYDTPHVWEATMDETVNNGELLRLAIEYLKSRGFNVKLQNTDISIWERIGKMVLHKKEIVDQIAEKTGPHFAVGDTCYSHEEDNISYNPDGKAIVARENEVSALRKTDMEKAYFGCHTDITIP